MESIELKQALPRVFAGRSDIQSDVWHRAVTFQRGHKYLIEAASGSGKSSLCSFLYGYRDDYEGIICFDRENIRQIQATRWNDIRRKELSILPQELRVFNELTAIENIQLKNGLENYKSRREIDELMDYLGVADKANERMSTLSYGQQQRIAFIRALCQPFNFILLDEPVSHLDAENGTRMSHLLCQEAEKQGAGILVTSIGPRLEMDYDVHLHL